MTVTDEWMGMDMKISMLGKEMLSEDRHKNYCQFDALSSKGNLSHVKLKGSQTLPQVKVFRMSRSESHSKGVVSEVS